MSTPVAPGVDESSGVDESRSNTAFLSIAGARLTRAPERLMLPGIEPGPMSGEPPVQYSDLMQWPGAFR